MPFCNLPSGSIHFTHNGVASGGPHLLLIHGAGGEVRCWPATWRLASDAGRAIGLSISSDKSRITNHSVYAIDLPGHGRSSGQALRSIEELADVVEAFIAAENLENVVLVGHSMGGMIALALAIRASPGVIGQIIVASAAKLGVTDQILDGLQTDFPATVDFIVKYSFDRASSPFFPQKARAYTIATGADATHADFTACANADLRGDTVKIDLPTLVIASETDRMVPHKHGAALLDTISGAQLASFTGCGHYPHLERTTLVEKPIAEFCGSLAK